MQIKRLIVAVGSLAAGAGLTWLIVYVAFETDFIKFAISNVVILFVSLSCAVGIWLDYFLDTKILKS